MLVMKFFAHYSSPNTIRLNKSSRIRLALYVARMLRMSDAYLVFVVEQIGG